MLMQRGYVLQNMHVSITRNSSKIPQIFHIWLNTTYNVTRIGFEYVALIYPLFKKLFESWRQDAHGKNTNKFPINDQGALC